MNQSKNSGASRSFWRGTLLLGLLTVGALVVACGAPTDEVKPTVTRIPNAANAPVVSPTPAVSPTAELAQVTSAPTDAPASAPTTAPQPTEAATTAPAAPSEIAQAPTTAPAAPASGATGDVTKGQQLASSLCLSCHSVDGSTIVGPTWKGLAGHEVTLSNGETVTADDAYLTQSIRNPGSQVVNGFPGIMPPFDYLSDQDIADLIAYIKSLGE